MSETNTTPAQPAGAVPDCPYAALSAPAPRTDGGMTAGEEPGRATFEGYRQNDPHTLRWEDVPKNQKARWALAELAARKATPAQPAGAVPDSLRALSEAASEDWHTNDATPYILGPPIDGDIDRFEVIARGPHGYNKNGDDVRKWRANRMFAVAAVKHVRALLASHPAGQSAGSGVLPSTETMVATARIARIERQMLEHGGVDSDDMEWMARGVRAAIKAGVADRQFAPDSTRTGQGEATYTAEMGEAADRYLKSVAFKGEHTLPAQFSWSDCLAAMLAARPADPEAQGQ